MDITHWDTQSVGQLYANQTGILYQELINGYSGYDLNKTSGAATSASGVPIRNYYYGLEIVDNINTESNVIGYMPKSVWASSGFRVWKEVSTAASNGIIGETGTISTRAFPTIATVTITPKIFYKSMDLSMVLQDLATNTADDALGKEQLIQKLLSEYGLHLSSMAMTKTIAGYGEAKPTLTSDALTSLDSICASSAEATQYSSTGNENIYNITRSTDTWANATVKYGASTGVGQDFSLGLFTDGVNSAREKGANPNLAYMGYDAYTALTTTAAAIQRIDTAMGVPSKEGFKLVQGGAGEMGAISGQMVTNKDVGYNIAPAVTKFYDGVAIIKSQHKVSEALASGAGTPMSRIYILDTTGGYQNGERPRISYSMLRPPTYFEGTWPLNPVMFDAFTERAVIGSFSDIVATFPAAMAKIRDLKVPVL